MHRATLSAAIGIVLAFQTNAQTTTPLPKLFTTPFSDENQYVEWSVLKDAALMLGYAKESKIIAIEVQCERRTNWQRFYKVVLPRKTLTLELSSKLPIWEPARYDSALAQIAEALELKKPRREFKPDSSILKDLEDPKIEMLAALSERVSRNLGKDMVNPELHEEAAALIAAFALRERLEPYEDLRWPLNRLTAHLAVRRWLGDDKPGLPARYALTTAYALMDLQTNALGRLRELEKDPATEAPWNRALFARITRDYRPLAALPASNLTPLEWAERLYATGQSLGADVAFHQVPKFVKAYGEKQFTSDYWACVFDGNKPGSVGLGRTFYLPGIALILADVGKAVHEVKRENVQLRSGGELEQLLNVEPGLCVHPGGEIAVLDWGAWAMQLHRRISVYYSRSLVFVRDQWGLPANEVSEQKQQMDRLLGGLWLVPCLQADFGDAESKQKVRDVFAARPHVVPTRIARSMAQSWNGYRKGLQDHGSTDPINWALGFPQGTLLGMEGGLSKVINPMNLQEMLDQAPYSLTAARWYLQQHKGDLALTRKLLGPIAEYDSAAGWWIADALPANQIEQKEVIYEKIALQDPYYYLTLYRLLQKSNPAKAVEYFEKARANETDRVGIASEATAVVRYYFAKGEKTKAREVAEEADTVGSAKGFEAMQTCCVLTHDFARGLKAARDEEERYSDPGVVLSYIDRVRREQPGFHEFDSLYQTKLAAANPGKLQAYEPSSSPPSVGVLILEDSVELKKNDILVAIDGKAVLGIALVRYLRRDYTRRTGEEDKIPLTVYRAGKYLDIKDTTAAVGVSEFRAQAQVISATRLSPPATVLPDPVPVAPSEPAYVNKFRLNGISGAQPNRLAMINGKTVAAGESGSVKLNGTAVSFRCISVGESSVIIEIEGLAKPKELKL